jgi:acyl carrier protein
MRFRADGTLEFLGRLDHQVKLHGYRIELGEIEAALDAHPDVRQSVALVHDDGDFGKRLVAYVVPEEGREPSTAELRRHLGESVPAYSIPSAIIRLESVPLTANGKLDTRALPRPGSSRPEIALAYVPPRTPTEETLAAIWAELLQIERIGAEDDFFELGGHSLLAVKMVARLRDALGVELALPAVFKGRTLAAVAEEVTASLLSEAPGAELERLLAEIEVET